MFGARVRKSSGLALVVAMVSCGGSASEPASPQSSPSTEPVTLADGDAPQAGSEESPTKALENESSPEEGVSAANKPPPGSPLEELMREHFKEVDLIRAAVIAGKPENAVKPAASLVRRTDLQEVPKQWVTSVRRLRDSASRVEESVDVAQAAAATADIGTSCGQCHQKFGGPSTDFAEAPQSDGSVASRMAQHVWATQRMWEGLYIPSGGAWQAGAKLLSSDPFPDEVLKRGGVYARSAAGDFSKIVAKASEKKNLSDRAALYAELLGTCATCHLATK